MSAKKKDVKIMCGSCYNDFPEKEIIIATLTVNPESEKNGFFCRNLCPKCKTHPYYENRIRGEEPYRKFN
jgi:predicted nucleic-acid-binding Zn-ribbon protein